MKKAPLKWNEKSIWSGLYPLSCDGGEKNHLVNGTLDIVNFNLSPFNNENK